MRGKHGVWLSGGYRSPLGPAPSVTRGGFYRPIVQVGLSVPGEEDWGRVGLAASWAYPTYFQILLLENDEYQGTFDFLL